LVDLLYPELLASQMFDKDGSEASNAFDYIPRCAAPTLG
jgi:hypothetical protein